MNSLKDVKIDLEELNRDKARNFQERLKFIDWWVAYVKKSGDMVWSEQQKNLIDSQINP